MAAPAEPTENALKVIDENDINSCGFCSLQVLDQDGYVKKTKGSNIEAPFQVQRREGGVVVLEANFSPNPLFYMQVANEEGTFVFGRWWLGASWSRTSQVCQLIPKDCQGIHKQLEDGRNVFVCEAEVPFLTGSPSRLVAVRFTTQEQRFVTKLVSVQVEVPAEAWAEYKMYRLKLWRSGKHWSGEDKAGEEKEDEKKDE